jgi:mannose-6-phosphate isomerase-like protein (cupin superfamily)
MIMKINIAEQAAKLKEPFDLVELAYVDDFVIALYICKGTLAWHKHVDQDELFFVQKGTILLESEWGSLTLQSEELAVVPKGVSHRSLSLTWSVVLLFHSKFLPDRKDGDRRIFALKGETCLKKVNVSDKAAKLIEPFSYVDLAYIDDFVVRLAICRGRHVWHKHEKRDEALFVQRGIVELETVGGSLPLIAGEIAVVPKGLLHRPASIQGAVIMLLTRRSPAPREFSNFRS